MTLIISLCTYIPALYMFGWFLNNKVIEGIYSDNSKFIEIFKSNGAFEFEMLSGEYKGVYRGQWKVENNFICFLYDGASQFDCVKLYYANDNNGNLQVFFGTDQEIFSQITGVNDINSSNSLCKLKFSFALI